MVEEKIDVKVPRVVRAVRFILPVLVLASGLGVLYASIIFKPKPKKEVREARVPTVETATIERYEKGLTIEVDGSVVPFREIDLATEVSGRIRLKADVCEAGNYVTAGTLLFEIDPMDYDLDVRRLNKELQQSEISVHAIDVERQNTEELITLAEEDLNLQQQEVARLLKLASGGAASRSELDRAKRTEVASRNSLARLKNQMLVLTTQRAAQSAAQDLASTRLEKAEIDLKRTKVIAPIDGIIVRELVEEDSFVQRGATLVQIEDKSIAEVKCNLRIDQLYWLWCMRDAEVDAASLDGAADFCALDYELPSIPAVVTYQVGDREFQWDGRLARYDGSGLDPRTRTVPCRIAVENPRQVRTVGEPTAAAPRALLRGMFVSVELLIDPETELARVPIAGLQPGKSIWRIEDNRLRIEKVRVARLTEDFALLELVDGSFKVGDKVITTPLPAPIDGMLVDDGSSLLTESGPEEESPVKDGRVGLAREEVAEMVKAGGRHQ